MWALMSLLTPERVISAQCLRDNYRGMHQLVTPAQTQAQIFMYIFRSKIQDLNVLMVEVDKCEGVEDRGKHSNNNVK